MSSTFIHEKKTNSKAGIYPKAIDEEKKKNHFITEHENYATIPKEEPDSHHIPINKPKENERTCDGGNNSGNQTKSQDNSKTGSQKNDKSNNGDATESNNSQKYSGENGEDDDGNIKITTHHKKISDITKNLLT
jgi:hypothetical protein